MMLICQLEIIGGVLLFILSLRQLFVPITLNCIIQCPILNLSKIVSQAFVMNMYLYFLLLISSSTRFGNVYLYNPCVLNLKGNVVIFDPI